MRTYLDCIPCLFRQVLEGARLTNATPRRQKRVIDEFAGHISGISLHASPPELARAGFALLQRVSGCNDPYADIKRQSNRLALRLLGDLRHTVAHSQDSLLTAVELAIAGNVIDFGAKNNLDVNAELKKIIGSGHTNTFAKTRFHYTAFTRALAAAPDILYLADNAGEVVFDRVLLEQIRRRFPQKDIYYAVKERPIINDALAEDAHFCEIGKTARVISTGGDTPGTVLSRCSAAFRRLFRNAGMVIGKGQGNYEALSRVRRPIFFLFMVKCPVVAQQTGCVQGDIVLIYQSAARLAYAKRQASRLGRGSRSG